MRIFWIFGALAVLLAAGALLFRIERRLRERTRRVLGGAAPADPNRERVFDELRMRHVGTGFADGMPLPAILETAGEQGVFCTGEALFVGRMIVPLAWVEDVAIESGSLRVRWRCGGELLETVLQAGLHEMERLRREIHLRQPNVIEKIVAMVNKT